MTRLKLIDSKPVTPEAAALSRKMATLVRGFPCLQRAAGVSPWDALELDRWATGPVSHGERLTASFLLSVWDPATEWQAGRFEVMEALRVWNLEHREAFLRWARDPWWP
jgi:hypothetical protein